MTAPRAPEPAIANDLIQPFEQVFRARGEVTLALLFGSRASQAVATWAAVQSP
jgi:hypothetical protein